MVSAAGAEAVASPPVEARVLSLGQQQRLDRLDTEALAVAVPCTEAPFCTVDQLWISVTSKTKVGAKAKVRMEETIRAAAAAMRAPSRRNIAQENLVHVRRRVKTKARALLDDGVKSIGLAARRR